MVTLNYTSSLSRKRAKMYQKILVPLDGSALAESALPYAQELAVKLGADVNLVHINEPTKATSQDIQQSYLEEMVKSTKQGAERLTNIRESQSAQVSSTILTGNPAEKIVEHADKDDTGLIVMATHGQSGIGTRALGSVADRVVRTTKCPLMLIKGNGLRPDASENGLLSKVLIPLDGTKQDETAISCVEELVVKLETEVILFQVLASECYVSGT